MRGIHYHTNPVVFESYFTSLHHDHPTSTRVRDNVIFAVPQPRTNLGKRSIKYDGIKAWAKVPQEIKDITNIGSFKYKLKEHIIANEIEWRAHY